MKRTFEFGHQTPPVCRLGLATRGNTHLDPKDIHDAVARGVNYLNWCGHPDGLSKAIAEMGPRREQIVLTWQLQAATAQRATEELDIALREMNTDWIDIVTFYYVESEREWSNIASGAYQSMCKARAEGKIRLLGLTSHQRQMAAHIASGKIQAPDQNTDRPLDMLMLRYNAAHRGAEQDVFPITDPIQIPVVVYTCLRWGALAKPTPQDPPGFTPPPPREWYRFCLANPSVAVAITAPNGRDELEHNLALLNDWHPPSKEAYQTLTEHGDRVYQHAGSFP
ncbi:MAG: aldo/keto reductase [bacterium]|nr:aldo/keto reductase [bacterium]